MKDRLPLILDHPNREVIPARKQVRAWWRRLRRQIHALPSGRHGVPEYRKNGGRQIDLPDWRSHRLAGESWGDDDERRPHFLFVNFVAMRELAMQAVSLAMIAGDDEHGVAREAEPIHCSDKLSDQAIGGQNTVQVLLHALVVRAEGRGRVVVIWKMRLSRP